MKKLVLLSVIGLAALMGQASASIITGVTATASSSANGFDRGAMHAVDGSGYNPVTGFVSTTADGTMWLSNGNGALGGVADSSPFITFDLGSVYAVTSAQVWNYNETGITAAGVASGTVLYSTDGISYTSLAALALAQAPGSSTVNFGQNVSIGVYARFIEFGNLTNFVGDPSGFVGLSEVVFSGIANTAVPEPASMMVLAVGLLGVGAARVRARR